MRDQRIVLVPLDECPVTTTLPQQIGAVARAKVDLPPAAGSLRFPWGRTAEVDFDLQPAVAGPSSPTSSTYPSFGVHRLAFVSGRPGD